MPAPLKKMSAIESPETRRAREGRLELMQRLTDFVMKHDVALTGPNLAAAVAGLSGSNAELARAFATREISGERITQDWLDQVARTHTRVDERTSALEKMMDRMEASLLRFARTAETAQHETSEHRGAIDAQIVKISEHAHTASPRAEIDRLIELSRSMLGRIVQVETAMQKSQAETAELRASLAEARSEADVDHLTRLPNRRAFERELERVAQLVEASGEKLSVAFCDVDHFKAINDTHGHDAGDRVLVAIARTLRNHSGNKCFAARHGGEEFVLLLQGLGLEEAKAKVDGIRRELSARQMINRETGLSFGKVTFSGGVSEVRGAGDAREALARADRALYRAKETGRDRIEAL
jgi:diguanylate cyclase